MVSVEAPSKPWSPNSVSAASRTASRRSSAVFRSVVAGFTRSKLSLTYYSCQGLGDTVEVRVGEPRVERKGQGAFEDAVCARERPLIRVGREAVERVRADLRLDSLRPQRPQHV